MSLLLLLFADIAAPGTLPLVPLLGPYAELADYVALGHERDQLSLGLLTQHGRLFSIGPYLAKGRGHSSVFLGIHTDRGWLVVSGNLYDRDQPPQRWVLHDNLRNSYAVESLSESGSWIIFRAVRSSFHRWGSENAGLYCLELELVCRLNRAGPLCAPPIPIAGQADCQDTSSPNWDWRRPITLSPDGKLVIPRRLPPKFPLPYASVGDELLPAGTWSLPSAATACRASTASAKRPALRFSVRCEPGARPRMTTRRRRVTSRRRGEASRSPPTCARRWSRASAPIYQSYACMEAAKRRAPPTSWAPGRSRSETMSTSTPMSSAPARERATS